MQPQQTPIPILPCPNCQENIFENGFYNYCTETISVREDNHAQLISGRLYLDHDEEHHETQDHECDVDAFCRNCETLLPWSLYVIRGLDGDLVPDAQKAIAGLLRQLDDELDADGPAAAIR